jgi:hypothetical protein
MPMLTWEEVKEAVEAAMKMMPDDFERYSADFMPQGVIPKLLMESVEIRIEAGRDFESAAIETAAFMTGLQAGWLLAERVHA